MDVALDDQENIRFEGSTKYDEGTFGFARRDDKIIIDLQFTKRVSRIKFPDQTGRERSVMLDGSRSEIVSMIQLSISEADLDNEKVDSLEFTEPPKVANRLWLPKQDLDSASPDIL